MRQLHIKVLSVLNEGPGRHDLLILKTCEDHLRARDTKSRPIANTIHSTLDVLLGVMQKRSDEYYF